MLLQNSDGIQWFFVVTQWSAAEPFSIDSGDPSLPLSREKCSIHFPARGGAVVCVNVECLQETGCVGSSPKRGSGYKLSIHQLSAKPFIKYHPVCSVIRKLSRVIVHSFYGNALPLKLLWTCLPSVHTDCSNYCGHVFHPYTPTVQSSVDTSSICTNQLFKSLTVSPQQFYTHSEGFERRLCFNVLKHIKIFRFMFSSKHRSTYTLYRRVCVNKHFVTNSVCQ
jgi:hypothetical protein